MEITVEKTELPRTQSVHDNRFPEPCLRVSLPLGGVQLCNFRLALSDAGFPMVGNDINHARGMANIKYFPKTGKDVPPKEVILAALFQTYGPDIQVWFINEHNELLHFGSDLTPTLQHPSSA